MPLENFRSMEEVLQQSVSQRKFQMALVLLFATAALLLASLGIFGVVSHAVAQRTGEIGIRLSLGASYYQIARMVMRQALTPVALGLSVAVLLSLAAGRLMSSLLFGVNASDPLAIAAVVTSLLGVAVLATLVPVRRAVRVSPAIALRYE